MRGLVGDLAVLQVQQPAQHLEVGGILAEGAAQARLPQLVSVVAVPTDEGGDLARPPGHARHQPSDRAPDLQVVEPDVAFANTLGVVGKQRERRDSPRAKVGHGAGDLVVVEPGRRDRPHLARHRSEELGELAGVGALVKAQRRAQAMARMGAELVLDLGGESLVEGVPTFLEDDAEMKLGEIGEDAAVDRVCPVETDAAGGLVHLASGLLADRQAAVEDPVHRRHADAGLAGEVCDRRSLHAILPSGLMQMHQDEGVIQQRASETNDKMDLRGGREERAARTGRSPPTGETFTPSSA